MGCCFSSSPQNINARRARARNHLPRAEIFAGEVNNNRDRSAMYHVTPCKDHPASAGHAEPDCCPICLAEVDVTASGSVRLPCGHLMHADCCERWLVMHPSCPMCRQSALPNAKTSTVDLWSMTAQERDFMRRLRPRVKQDPERMAVLTV